MKKRISGSFRDLNGFLYTEGGTLYRQINTSYKDNYDRLLESGLYQALSDKNALIKHQEVKTGLCDRAVYKTILPELVPFVSYPYEWSFSQLKDAAILTLDIQMGAVKRGMTLKDASAYNVQFINNKPVFIDTLSFEKYSPGAPWIAYKQFCQHFLSPLVLASYVDIRLLQLMRVFIDGVPLDVTSRSLPMKTRFSPSLLMHIHLHSKSQIKYADDGRRSKIQSVKVSETGMLGLIDGLRRTIEKLEWTPKGTEWGEYYEDTNYTDNATENKKSVVEKMVSRIKPSTVWDFGANTGEYSKSAKIYCDHVVSWDIDDAAIEKHYLRLKKDAFNESILPLRLDLTNPSNGIGWAGNERLSLAGRGKVDLIMALALVHHLAISNNVPLDSIANYLAELTSNLIIEFVPKSDSQVKRLLNSRVDIFDEYNEVEFQKVFEKYFDLIDSEPVQGSERTMFLYATKAPKTKEIS